MGKSSGTLTQDFKIELNIDELIDYISEQVISAIANFKDNKGRCYFSDVELDESDIDGTIITITGTYDTSYTSYYAPATREEPEEYELECDSIGTDDAILNEIHEDIRKYITVWAVEEKDEGKRFHEPPGYWGED